MVPGLDSSSPPSPASVAAARAAGVAVWSGYLADHPNVNLAHPWTAAQFAVARGCPGAPIAYCSGRDDPVTLRAMAAQLGVRLCLDVESSIEGDGAWVNGWLFASGAGLYGSAWVHAAHAQYLPFRIVSEWPAVDPRASWPPRLPRYPAGAHGWQWRGGSPRFGVNVDESWLDDSFAFTITEGPTVLDTNDATGIARLMAESIFGTNMESDTIPEVSLIAHDVQLLGVAGALDKWQAAAAHGGETSMQARVAKLESLVAALQPAGAGSAHTHTVTATAGEPIAG